MALKPIALLEQLNSSFQAKSSTISGMLSSVAIVQNEFAQYRNDVSFRKLLDETFTKIFKLKFGFIKAS